MLVLTRKVSQRIRVGTDIVITIIECHDDKTRIGIEAPADVRVDREEIFLIRQQQAREAEAQQGTLFPPLSPPQQQEQGETTP